MSNNYVELKVSELRDECKSRNLDTTGLKVHLVERLNKYDREQLIKSKVEINNPTNSIKEETKPEAKAETVSSTGLGVHAHNVISMDNENIKIDHGDDKNNAEKVTKEDRKRPYPSDESIVQKTHKLDLFKLASSEEENWESRTDIHLDFYNSDMNIAINEDGYSATSLNEDGFEYMCAGVKANYGIKSGKVYYEVKVLKSIKVDVNSDAGESNFIKVGWSIDNEFLALGEGKLSFAYDCLGRKMNDENLSEYGIKFDEDSIIGCFVEFHGDSFVIHYSVNGVNQGVAFTVPSRDLKDNILIPHIYVKNVAFEVNFGQNDNESSFPPQTAVDENKTVEDMTWTLLGKVNLNQRFRALKPPKSKSECEVLMMCGLPSCGKTYWTDKQIKKHYEKRYNVLSINTVLEKMKVINLRKKVSTDRWESFISSATHCLNKLLEIAVSRRRNFILDQTNVYPSAQRRRMKPFEEFIRKAIIIVPTDDEYQRRMNQVIQEEGKDVPESAVLQLKENFVIPEENSELFNEIMFIELQRPEAEELIKKYNEEARNLKKKESNSDNKSKEDSDEDNFGKWATSPKSCTEDNEKSAPKKSRWNDQIENRKESRSRDRHDRSPEKLSRKNDYKGGFCFSREASDSGRGCSRSSDVNYRSDDRYSEKPKDQRADRSGNRSAVYRKPVDSNDRKPRFDARDDSRFGNRNPIGGSRDSRPRDRGSDSRGGGMMGGRDRLRGGGGGGFNDRRQQPNSYGNDNDQNSRSKFPPNTYNDRNAIGGGSTYPNQDRNSRFPQSNSSERNNFRGIAGRGSSASNNQNSMYGNEFRNAPESRDFSHYSGFNPHVEQNRQANKPWQQDFKNEGIVENPRRPHGYDNQTGGSNRSNQMGVNYDQQFGGQQVNRGSMGGTVNSRGGKGVDQMSSQYNDRKQMFTGSRGAPGNRGGRSNVPLMDSPPVDDYSYGSKSYEAPPSKFGNKSPYSSDIPKVHAYKESPRQDVYNNAKPSHVREGYSRFGDSAKVGNQCDTKSMDNTPREFSGMSHSNSTTNQYDNYQSYDNSQYNQNQGYYNYYTSDSGKEPQVAPASSAYPSANPSSRLPYSNSSFQPSGTTGFQSSTQIPHQQQAPSNISSSTGYQSAVHGSSGTGYQSANYQSSNPAGASGYQSNYPTGATTYQSNYPSTDPTSSAGYPPISNPSAVNSYTNPYNAIYDNASSYNSTYYGQNNTYAQSSSYGDNTVPSKFSDFVSKPPATDRAMQPPPTATAPPVSASGPPSAPAGQTQANWGTGYGNDFNQYYGQYYGQ